MVFENIRIAHGNFAIDRTGSSFYTVDHSVGQLLKKNSSAVVVAVFTLDRLITEVHSLKYDGYFYWTLERQGTVGFRVRRWEIGADTIVRMRDEFSYSSDNVNTYNVYSMTVEYYGDLVGNSTTVGQTIFEVEDGAKVAIGDRLVIGPSAALGFEGTYNFTSVISKSTNFVTVSPALTSAFNANDPIYFTRSLFVFSDDAATGLSGALYKFRAADGFLQSLDVSNLFNKVRASIFFKNYVMFIRGGEVIWYDPNDQLIFKSQAIDNLNVNRSEHLEASDLAGFSETLYRLEQEHVFFNEGLQVYQTENWSPQFNYNTSSLVPAVYFISVKADPPIVHKAATGVPLSSTQSAITVQVLDQFRSPVFNRLVSFATTAGSVSPISATTDSEGKVTTTYTGDSTVGQVKVTATVS